MSKLRLGKIEDDKPIKLAIEVSGAVHRDLAAYARAHAKETGLDQPLSIERLIPPMIERFMEGDRVFARHRRTSAG